MKRRNFIAIAGSAVVIAGTGYYLSTDKSNFVRNDFLPAGPGKFHLKPDENAILYLASLAPSGHNTQPWFIKYVEPYHWIIGNDKKRWLPGVDPTQRETILSIGAFVQNLEYAANNLGYDCQFHILATTNQDEHIMEIKLNKGSNRFNYDVEKIVRRRTVRSNFLSDPLKKADIDYLFNEDPGDLHFISNTAKEYRFLNDQTIEANRLQSYRDPAEKELSNWIRFSTEDAREHRDGLTAASMGIEGVSGWVVRNFYGKANVMEKGFREQNVSNVIKQVSQSAGWMLITSKGNAVAALIETGKQMQRLFLKVRDKGIAIHPMSQILEEPSTSQTLNTEIGISDNMQFILRVGYIKAYPEPVSLRRPVDWFIHV